ncbi:hypothetical protein B0H63DRAFT_513484 [Podospora didyma]|uniref:Uncharacterized protein n=1 Tax=Podospora didyma TaxID=330526 RepID=A0AAE0N5V8_9PEZI|nr:hypothetical protein B0H63DRAFT_513484 [Podospora didyma]
MAPRTRAQRQHTSTTRTSVNTTTDSAPSLPDCESPDDDDRGPSRSINKPGEEDAREEELEKVPRLVHAQVLGCRMRVPLTYDPDTYDPDRPVPWTPEPEPYDAETYAAWGRKHFGEEWCKLREAMLREGNIYRVLPRVQPPRTASTAPIYYDDSDLSGISTFPHTPEPRESSPPLPDDPWESLEYERKRYGWSEEEYQWERIFRNEKRIDWARPRHENQEGGRQREKELEDIEKVRYIPGTEYISGEYERRMKKFNLRAEGWTQEQVDAEDRRIVAVRVAYAEEKPQKIFRENKPMTERLVYRFEVAGVSRERQEELAQEAGHELASETEEIEAEEISWKAYGLDGNRAGRGPET